MVLQAADFYIQAHAPECTENHISGVKGSVYLTYAPNYLLLYLLNCFDFSVELLKEAEPKAITPDVSNALLFSCFHRKFPETAIKEEIQNELFNF